MSWAFVNSGSASSAAGAATIAVTYSPANGDQLFVCATCDNSNTVSNITDGTNTYNLITSVTPNSNSQFLCLYWCPNIAGSPSTITANYSASPGHRSIQVVEFSGLVNTNVVDASGNTANSGFTSTPSISITPSVGGGAIVSFCYDYLRNTTPQNVTANGGTTITGCPVTYGSPVTTWIGAQYQTATTGSNSVGFTATQADNMAIVAVVVDQASGAVVTPITYYQRKVLYFI